MKKIIGRFFLVLALVLTSINICYPNDVECSDGSYLSSSTSPSDTGNSNGSQEEHHCSGLSCNSWMSSFSSEEVKSSTTIISMSFISFKIPTYPQVSLSTDKPPTV